MCFNFVPAYTLPLRITPSFNPTNLFLPALWDICETKPAFTDDFWKIRSGFREFLVQKPARPGGTSLSVHIGEYPPPPAK